VNYYPPSTLIPYFLSGLTPLYSTLSSPLFDALLRRQSRPLLHQHLHLRGVQRAHMFNYIIPQCIYIFSQFCNLIFSEFRKWIQNVVKKTRIIQNAIKQFLSIIHLVSREQNSIHFTNQILFSGYTTPMKILTQVNFFISPPFLQNVLLSFP